MMGRYPILHVFSWTLLAFGAATWAITGVGVIILLTVTPSFQHDPGNIISGLIQFVLGLSMSRLIVGGLVSGLALMGMGQFFLMMMDLAEDTRSLRVNREREMIARHKAAQLPDMWNDRN